MNRNDAEKAEDLIDSMGVTGIVLGGVVFYVSAFFGNLLYAVIGLGLSVVLLFAWSPWRKRVA